MQRHPAYRVTTAKLHLRCVDPADAADVHDAFQLSREHLSGWMDVLAPDASVEDTIGLLAAKRARFDGRTLFTYVGFARDADGAMVGLLELDPKPGRGVLSIGGWVRSDQAKKGYAVDAVAAAARIGIEIMGAHRMEIVCDPGNVNVASLAQRLGFVHEATLRQRGWHGDSPADEMMWRLLADEHRRGPTAACDLQAFDPLGRRLL